jgi:hypothetical protein
MLHKKGKIFVETSCAIEDHEVLSRKKPFADSQR